jgi:hypothetical protein
MDAVSTSIVTRTGYVGANTLWVAALKKDPFTGHAGGRTLTVCAICTDSAGSSAIEERLTNDSGVLIRYWPKADMTVCGAHVRFRG